MSATDWVLLAIVGVSALFGLMRGFVGVVASLAAWVLAGWAAFRFGGELGADARPSDGEPSAGQVFAGYALSFIGVLVVVGLVGWLREARLVNSAGLSGMDRALGLALGRGARRRSSPACWCCCWASRRCRAMPEWQALAGGAGVPAGRAVVARLAAAMGGAAGRFQRLMPSASRATQPLHDGPALPVRNRRLTPAFAQTHSRVQTMCGISASSATATSRRSSTTA